MLDPSPQVNGPFHARMRRTGGVWRAEYSGEINPNDPDEREFLDFHIGTEEREVRAWVEQMAHGLGYTEVVWLKD